MAKLSVTLVDAYGRTTHRVYGMETKATLAEYTAAAAAFLTDVGLVSDLGVVRADLILNVEGVEATAAVAGSNVDVGATFSGFIVDGNGKKASAKVPAIKPALVAADGSISITGAVAGYLANFEDAADMNLSDGEQIETWIRGALDR